MRRRRPPRPCIACSSTNLEGWQRLCGPCWRRLPWANRRAIAEAMSDRNVAKVAQLAIEAAKWLQEHTPAAETARRLGERD